MDFGIALLAVFLIRFVIRFSQLVYYAKTPFVMLCSKSWFQLWWDVEYQVFPQYTYNEGEEITKEQLESTKECVEDFQLIMADIYVTKGYNKCILVLNNGYTELEEVVSRIEAIYELEKNDYENTRRKL